MRRSVKKMLWILMIAGLLSLLFCACAFSEPIASGDCGDSLTWTIENNVLTISGTGAMWDCEPAPWLEKRNYIKSVVIGDGVTCIGTYAFDDCYNLESASLPANLTDIREHAFGNCIKLNTITLQGGLTTIGMSAFYGCSALTQIELPDSLEVIGTDAFYGCSDLTSLTIPENVTQIGLGAFRYCSSLASLHIPASVTTIGGYPFTGCSSLTAITVDEQNPNYDSYDGALYNKTKTAFIACPGGKTMIDLADSVKTVEAYAFYECKKLTAITLPEDVNTIKDYAFGRCTALTAITFPDGLTSIGNYGVFQSITAIKYANAESQTAQTLSKKGFSFRAAGGKCDIICRFSGDTYLSTEAYNADAGTTSLVIPSGVTVINSDICSNCTDTLTGVSIPLTVTDFGTNTFNNCTSLTHIEASSAWASAFNKTQIQEYIIPEGETSIAGYAFQNWTALETISIPDSVTSIGYQAFYGCSALEQVSLPKVTTIETNAFLSCASLTSVELGEGLTTIGANAFAGDAALTSITIPTTVTSIGNDAFYNCNAVRYATIGSDGAKALGAKNYSFRIDGFDGNLLYKYNNNVLTGLMVSKADSNIVDAEVPNGVEYINSQAFSGCTKLESVSLPVSLKEIWQYAFSGCTALTDVEIADGVTNILNYAFHNCTSLETITLPGSVLNIGFAAFSGCTSLSDVTLSEGLRSIEREAFSGCSLLESLTIPNSVTSIDSQAFTNCNAVFYAQIGSDGAKALGKISEKFKTSSDSKYSLRYSFTYQNNEITSTNLAILDVDKDIVSISIPQEVTAIGDSAFANCTDLTEVEILAGVKTIGTSAFSGCTSLTEIALPSNLTSIGMSAFKNCSGLTGIVLPDRVTSIGREAFSGCAGLIEVNIPEGLTSLGNSTFSDCTKLTAISFPSTLASVPSCVCNKCVLLENVTIAAGPTSIGSMAFDQCDALEEIVIPEGITSIESQAFWYCKTLKSVTLPSTLTSIGYESFYFCKAIKSITIPTGLTEVDPAAFRDCDAALYTFEESVAAVAMSKAGISFRPIGMVYDIKYLYDGETRTGIELCSTDKDIVSLKIPTGITSIGREAFDECKNLISVEIPNSVTSIGYHAFGDCYSLPSITIPASVTDIGDLAFWGCKKLSKVCFLVQDYNKEINIGDRIIISTKPTIYCYEFTDVDTWCRTNTTFPYVYLNASTLAEARTLTLPEYFHLAAGETRKLDYNMFPADGSVITWGSSNSSIVSVTNGEVVATAPGTVTIMATVGSATDSVIITVYQPATGMTLSEKEAWLKAKDSLQLEVIGFEPVDAYAEITWSSSDTRIATVNETGLVITYKPGDVIITATTETGMSKSCLIHLYAESTAVIRLPKGLRRIEPESFMNDGTIEIIIIPDSVTYIAGDAFDECGQITIYGKAGGPAEEYAQTHENCTFVEIEE